MRTPLSLCFLLCLCPEAASLAQVQNSIPAIPLPEHPRPDWQRADWMNLNGWWDFAFDPQDLGLQQAWFQDHVWPQQIRVPYVHQSRLSGIGETEHCRQVWYRRKLSPPPSWHGKRIFLHFGAADFLLTVWVNGQEVGQQESGYLPCSFDLTPFLRKDGNDQLVVRVFDDPMDPAQPRGKQHPSGKRNRWHYTHMTGIWQTVWLEARSPYHLQSMQFYPQVKPCAGTMKVQVLAPGGSQVRFHLYDRKGRLRQSDSAEVQNGTVVLNIETDTGLKPWTPEDPYLYPLELQLEVNGQIRDHVESYVGFRTFEAKGGKFLLNGEPIFLHGLLDQGYWPTGLYTPPSDDRALEDLQRIKALDFNHLRRHQIVADPRFLYHCDFLGLLVWGEMANAGEGHFSRRATELTDRLWQRVLQRDFNHPSVVTWVYSNENWMHGGDPEARIAHYQEAYQRMKRWDPTRPIIDTSGYHHVATDVLDIHRHPPQARLQAAKAWAEAGGGSFTENVVFLKDFPYQGQPIVVSEWVADGFDNFDSTDFQAWLLAYASQLADLAQDRGISGHAYVQFCDVETERNGLYHSDRRPKWNSDEEELLVELHRRFLQRDPEFDWEAFLQDLLPENPLEIRSKDAVFRAEATDTGYSLTFQTKAGPVLRSPAEGLWGIGYQWEDEQPRQWFFAHPEEVRREGPWLMAEGILHTPDGPWKIRDAFRFRGDLLEGTRRWTYEGKETSSETVLRIGWLAPGKGRAAVLPGLLYHGNPSGARSKDEGWHGLIPLWKGEPGERTLFQEHRFPAPFASLEWPQEEAQGFGIWAALHSWPSLVPFAKAEDLWWSLGLAARHEGTEFCLWSGPVAMNHQPGWIKSRQGSATFLKQAYLQILPGKTVEKRFFLHGGSLLLQGDGFRHALQGAMELHKPYTSEGMPPGRELLSDKLRFALSRWRSQNEMPGFAMYPHLENLYVMGWAGQSEAPGYALQVLAEPLERPELATIGRQTLDTLCQAPFNEHGFLIAVDGKTGEWSRQDPISQGQAMTQFARAIRVGRKQGADTRDWERFLKRACEIHAERILASHWKPRSTAEAFLIAPLALAFQLFEQPQWLQAAEKAGQHYAERHRTMQEPYWGGTLDARCEDKEGAWGALQAFFYLHRVTGKIQYLQWAEHAADVALTYTYLWNVDLPPGRLRDHGLKTRGWTSVSVQNMHLDVFGVLYAPELFRLGQLTYRKDLQDLAVLMYRSCGQMIDPYGSQGEQLQQTRFAQGGDLSDPKRDRGGYVEGWTVFWITAHFLTAAAKFEEMHHSMLQEP
ncbi:MAG: hypothetical protein DWQ01_05980 [Planctomycetota bacterium]|nr:MAG: hypothetical protein DWQ01_05980 [Planctomycetota bacterium]